MSDPPLAYARVLEKFHGAGNSLLIHDAASSTHKHWVPNADDAKALCDTRYGIGADGLMDVRASPDDASSLRVTIWNADGTNGGICGNGMRCIATLLSMRGVDPCSTKLYTDSGTLIKVRPSKDGLQVCLGRPTFCDDAIGIKPHEFTALDLCGAINRYSIGGRESTFAGIGNPHAIIWCRSDEQPIEVLREVAPRMLQSSAFPDGINIHAVQVLTRDTLHVVSHERGVGETPSCGTGVCAALASGVLMGSIERSISALCPGGELTATWVSETKELWLGGDVQHIASIRLGTSDLGRGRTNTGGSGTLSVSRIPER